MERTSSVKDDGTEMSLRAKFNGNDPTVLIKFEGPDGVQAIGFLPYSMLQKVIQALKPPPT